MIKSKLIRKKLGKNTITMRKKYSKPFLEQNYSNLDKLGKNIFVLKPDFK